MNIFYSLFILKNPLRFFILSFRKNDTIRDLGSIIFIRNLGSLKSFFFFRLKFGLSMAYKPIQLTLFFGIISLILVGILISIIKKGPHSGPQDSYSPSLSSNPSSSTPPSPSRSKGFFEDMSFNFGPPPKLTPPSSSPRP